MLEGHLPGRLARIASRVRADSHTHALLDKCFANLKKVWMSKRLPASERHAAYACFSKTRDDPVDNVLQVDVSAAVLRGLTKQCAQWIAVQLESRCAGEGVFFNRFQ